MINARRLPSRCVALDNNNNTYSKDYKSNIQIITAVPAFNRNSRDESVNLIFRVISYSAVSLFVAYSCAFCLRLVSHSFMLYRLIIISVVGAHA